MNTGIIPTTWSGYILSALRVIAGLLFLAHGLTKLVGWPATAYFPETVPLFSFMGLTGALEILGGVLIVLGLFTRITAFVMAGMMAVAYFMAHAPQGFHPIQNGGELAIMFCFVFLYLAATGPGPVSIDAKRA
jgi:putative oxidoreductase